MARAALTETLLAACPQFANLKTTLPMAHTIAAAERIAGTHALNCPTCNPIAQAVRDEQRLTELTRTLTHPVAGANYWLTVPHTGPASLVVPVPGGHLAWSYTPAAHTLAAAVDRDLVTFGPITCMPRYRHGGRRAWRPGMHGHTIALLRLS